MSKNLGSADMVLTNDQKKIIVNYYIAGAGGKAVCEDAPELGCTNDNFRAMRNAVEEYMRSLAERLLAELDT